MSRREKEKAASLDKLGKLAYSTPPAPARPPPPKPAAPARPAPKAVAPPRASTPTAGAAAAARARERQLAERREKLAEEKSLRERREKELARSSGLEWRGMDRMGVPASIRRTGFDRDEPSTAQKIHDILGENREKAGRAKAREKGKRAGGKR